MASDVSLDELVRKAAPGARIVLPEGAHRLSVRPRAPLTIVGASHSKTRILSKERVVVTSALRLQDVAVEAVSIAFEVAGGELSLTDVDVAAEGTAVFVHGGEASLGGCEIVGGADTMAIEVSGEGSRLRVRGGAVRGAQGVYVHTGADAWLHEVELLGDTGPAVRVHGGRARVERSQIRGGEAGVYVAEQGRAVLRGCSLSGSAYAQIEVRDSFVRVVGGSIVDGEDDGIDVHGDSTVEIETVQLRGNDIAVRALGGRVRLLEVVVEGGRGACVVSQDDARVTIDGGTFRARGAAAIEAFDRGEVHVVGAVHESDEEAILAYDDGRITEEARSARPIKVLDDDACWRMIDEARAAANAAGARDVDAAVPRALVDVLARTSIATIVRFDRFLRERFAEALRWELWAVAYVMNGGCSDDGFDYFLGWLVGQGRERYTAALRSPELAAEGYGPDDEPFSNEDMLGVGSKAYCRLTGSTDVSDFYEVYVERVPRRITGTPFDEETVLAQYPSLARFH